MSKSYRFDPDADFGGDNQAPVSKKELKRQRRERRKDDTTLDDQMQPDDDGDRAW